MHMFMYMYNVIFTMSLQTSFGLTDTLDVQDTLTQPKNVQSIKTSAIGTVASSQRAGTCI